MKNSNYPLMSPAYVEGWDAYFTHATTLNSNPYTEGSQDYYDWQEGFIDACKF